jgi:enoyl-[acyl-carrier protein] reductase II
MAAALALGAEGVQLGTAMVSCQESPIHDNWKNAIVAAAETDTVMLNRHTSPALRALRTETSSKLEFDTDTNAMMTLGADPMALYFGGDMEASLALSGQVAGRIDEIRPVADIIRDCASGAEAVIANLAGQA